MATPMSWTEDTYDVVYCPPSESGPSFTDDDEDLGDTSIGGEGGPDDNGTGGSNDNPDDGAPYGGGGGADNEEDPDSPIAVLEDCLPGYERDENDKCVKKCDEGEERYDGNCVTKCAEGKERDSNGDCVTPCDTSKDDLKKVFPNTTDSKLQEISDAINKYSKDFGVDSKEKLRHFISQAGHESAKFTAFEENLNYRWGKLGTDYWSKYFNPSSDGTKDSLKQNPNDYKRSSLSSFVNKEKFANYVYDDANRSSSGKLGNTTTGDGYKFRGRGIFQLTGRSNYQKFTDFYQDEYDANKDFTTNPDELATDTEIAILSALWYYKKRVQDKLTIDSTTTVLKVTKKVNGGKTGLKDRKELHTKAKTNIDCN